jgi:hypothetical protein
MKKIRYAAIVSILLFLGVAPVLAQSEVLVMEVVIQESEPGIGNFISRLLLSKDFLRLDDGKDEGDFTLFNRKSHEIHSFNHEDKSHLIMKPIAPRETGFKLDYKVTDKVLKDAPTVAGVAPMQHQYFADTHLCKQSINVKGLLPEVTQALIDYEQAIMAQNSQTYDRIPSSVRSSCYMANNYLHVSDYLQSGFPLFVRDDLGRQKQLMSFQQLAMPASLFQQIEGYTIFYPNEANLEPGE